MREQWAGTVWLGRGGAEGERGRERRAGREKQLSWGLPACRCGVPGLPLDPALPDAASVSQPGRRMEGRGIPVGWAWGSVLNNLFLPPRGRVLREAALLSWWVPGPDPRSSETVSGRTLSLLNHSAIVWLLTGASGAPLAQVSRALPTCAGGFQLAVFWGREPRRKVGLLAEAGTRFAWL